MNPTGSHARAWNQMWRVGSFGLQLGSFRSEQAAGNPVRCGISIVREVLARSSGVVAGDVQSGSSTNGRNYPRGRVEKTHD